MLNEVIPNTQTAWVAALSALGGSSATAVAVFFIRDFFTTTKKELHELVKAVVAITHELQTCTRDLRKLEGAIESQQRRVDATLEKISESTANIKALWAALQRIHPNAVPKRLSDSNGPDR